jgi:TatD DNase family protein
MSFSGVITFKNAQNLRDALQEVPDELLLVETDAPFLTPVPRRGTPNASINLAYTVRAISALRGVSEEKICDLLFSNAARVFGTL